MKELLITKEGWPVAQPKFTLRFDVGVLDVRIVHQLIDLDFIVEMADVANDGLVFHLGHVFDGDDVAVTGGRNEDVTFLDGFFHRRHFEAFHCSL